MINFFLFNNNWLATTCKHVPWSEAPSWVTIMETRTRIWILILHFLKGMFRWLVHLLSRRLVCCAWFFVVFRIYISTVWTVVVKNGRQIAHLNFYKAFAYRFKLDLFAILLKFHPTPIKNRVYSQCSPSGFLQSSLLLLINILIEFVMGFVDFTEFKWKWKKNYMTLFRHFVKVTQSS